MRRSCEQSPSARLENLEPRLLLEGTWQVPYEGAGAIPVDYSRDVTADLAAFFASVPDGSTVVFPSLSYSRFDGSGGVGYRIDGAIELTDRHDLTVEGGGAMFVAFDDVDPAVDPQLAYDRDQWVIRSSSGLTLRNVVTYGANDGWSMGDDGYDAAREGQHAYQIDGGSSDVLLEGVEAYETFGDGVYIGGDSVGVTVRTSTIQRVGRQGIAPCYGSDILIESNFIDDCRRGVIDIEPYAESWSVNNLRILGNTLGDSRLLLMPMGGAGSYGAIYVADNVALGSNGVPEIMFSRSDPSTLRGPFVCVNNRFTVGGSSTAGFRFSSVDGLLFAGNEATFLAPDRQMPAMQITESSGVVLGGNLFAGASDDSTDGGLVVDGATSPLVDWDNPLADSGWASQMTVTEDAQHPGSYVGRAPYSDEAVSGGQLIAIWRAGG